MSRQLRGTLMWESKRKLFLKKIVLNETKRRLISHDSSGRQVFHWRVYCTYIISVTQICAVLQNKTNMLPSVVYIYSRHTPRAKKRLHTHRAKKRLNTHTQRRTNKQMGRNTHRRQRDRHTHR